MPSPFSLGVQNADHAFDGFSDGQVTFFNVSLTTLQTVAEVAHGFAGTPDFVMVSLGEFEIESVATGPRWSATATTLTINYDQTLLSGSVSVFAANLS